MSETKITLPSGGGAYERQADGSLKQVETPTAPVWSGVDMGHPVDAEPAVEAPVKGVVERPAKRSPPAKTMNEES